MPGRSAVSPLGTPAARSLAPRSLAPRRSPLSRVRPPEAIAEGRQIAEEPAIELLVYLAGTRQIDRALQLSLDPAVETYLAVVSGGETQNAVEAVRSELFDAVESVHFTPEDPIVRSWYDIEDAELAVTDGDIAGIVHERVAMVVPMA